MERWLFDGLAKGGADWRQAVAVFTREAATTLDLLSDALPEIDPLDDTELLTWLHDCVSPRTFRSPRRIHRCIWTPGWRTPTFPAGSRRVLGDRWLKVVSVRGLPSITRPGLLDALGALPFPYRWTARWIGLDKPEAEREIVKLRKRWFAKRKGVGVLLRRSHHQGGGAAPRYRRGLQDRGVRWGAGRPRCRGLRLRLSDPDGDRA